MLTMILRITLILLSVAALMQAGVVPRGKKVGSASRPDCEIYALPACTREYDPVCSSDGKTHSNECMLCLDNIEKNLNNYVVKKGSC